MYREMSPKTAEFIDFMFENELFDVLAKEGKAADPSFMKGDFVFNRWLRMWHTKLRHFKLFKTYYK